MNQLLTTKALTMTSREIAELTGKRHDNVMRDIRTMLDDLEHSSNLRFVCKSTTYIAENGQEYSQYELDYNASVCLVSGYDAVTRMKIIQRWQDLEAGAPPVAEQLAPLVKGFTALVDALKAIGLDGNAAAIGANNAIVRLSGLNILTLTDNTHLIAEKQEQAFTPTQLGELCSPRMSAQLMNLSLQNAGLQHRVGNSWVVTEEGKPFARFYYTGKRHGDGTPVIQTKWLKSVLDELDKEDDI